MHSKNQKQAKDYRPFSFEHPLKSELERLLSLENDLRRAQGAIQTLINSTHLLQGSGTISTALYTQALVSYIRCFSSGRRKGIERSIFDASPELALVHDKIKQIRDKHVAHQIGKLERWDILVAAKDSTSRAIGLGVHFWSYAYAARADLLKFQKLTKFVTKHVEANIKSLGDSLAKKAIGPRATWRSAQKSFYKNITQEDIYGPTYLR